MKKLLFYFIIFFFVLIKGQTIPFNKKITWKTLNENTGVLLVKTANAFYGLDSDSKKVNWENSELKKWEPDSYEEIPFTPFIKLVKTPFINSTFLSKTLYTKGKMVALLDVTNGQTIFNSKKVGFNAVFDFKINPKNQTIFIQGIIDKHYAYALYDYKKKKVRWKNLLEKSDLLSKLDENIKSYRGAGKKVFTDREHNLFVLTHNFLVKLDAKNGKALQYFNDVKNVLYDRKHDLLVLITSKLDIEAAGDKVFIKAIQNSNENTIWKTTPSLDGKFEQGFIKNHKAVIVTSKGFNIIDLKNGKLQFEKLPDLPLIKNIIPTNEGFAVAQSNWLNYIDKNGKEVWKAKQNIAHTANEKPIDLIVKNDRLLFSSPSFSNVIDLKSGKKIWEEDLHFQPKNFITRNLDVITKHAYITRKNQENLLVLADNHFYIINPTIPTHPSMVGDLDFKGEKPSLTLINKGYLVSSKNHYYAFNKQGDSIYSHHFNKREKKSLTDQATSLFETGYRIYGNTTSFVTRQISNVSHYALMSDKFGFVSDVGTFLFNNYNNIMSYTDTSKLTEYGDIGSSYEKLFSRAKSSHRLKNIRLIALYHDSGTSLISLDINSGKTKPIMELNTKSQEYLIDNISQTVYIFNKKEVQIKKIP